MTDLDDVRFEAGRSVARRWDCVLALHAIVEQAATTQLRRHGMGVSEFRAVHLLATAEAHEVRLLDLADSLNLDRSSVSRLVDRLVRSDLARRESCGDDRRGVFIVITERGADLHQEVAPIYETTIMGAISQGALRPDLAELAGLLIRTA